MFDLVGIFNFDTIRSPSLPFQTLPLLKWGQVNLPVQTVTGNGLVAQFVEYIPGDCFYCMKDGLHLFVVGEVRLRSNTILPATYELQSGNGSVLSASSLWALCQADSERFIRHLKGNFILVLVNERLQRTTLYNSRFGISPFYYALDGDRFIFSTSVATVATCLSHEAEIDPVAVAELALFNYPLDDRTYFQQIKMLRPAEVVRVNADGVRHESWWDVRTLYDAPLYSKHQALELGSELFYQTVNDYAADLPRVRFSFTSGFDSRAILSVLEKDGADLLGYSFGIPGSLNVSIPEQICADLGVPFHPIYLDGEYEQVFDEYAFRALWLSDCLSTVERANYPYAFEKLAGFSPVVITGLFGSELMRTFQNVGHIVSANLARINLAADPLAELGRALAAPKAAGYFANHLLRRTAEEVVADVSAALLERFGEMPPDRRFYMFLLTEGLRKYFGAELQMERPWGRNRFPFLDDEFVEFAFRAPFAGPYSRTLKPTVENRFSSQYFYAYVIRKYRPELLEALTDHGHSPGDVLGPFALFKIGPKYLYRRWKRRRRGYREFKTEEWTEELYRKHLFQRAVRDDLFSPALREHHNSGAWKAHRLEFAKAASFKLWLEMLES